MRQKLPETEGAQTCGPARANRLEPMDQVERPWAEGWGGRGAGRKLLFQTRVRRLVSREGPPRARTWEGPGRCLLPKAELRGVLARGTGRQQEAQVGDDHSGRSKAP